MKGKIAFVAGAAVGYVLGTRAGRARYEQIKRGAEAVWQTDAVQRGVGAVRGAAQGKLDELRSSALRAGRDAFAALVHHDTESRASSGSGRASAGSRSTRSSRASTATRTGAEKSSATGQDGSA